MVSYKKSFHVGLVYIKSPGMVWYCITFFFVKQKTAYEMRISDWSSDVCSSDLRRPVLLTGCAGAAVALALTGICFAIGVTDGAVIIALLCMFVAFFDFSLGPIKWIVISELFPTGVRARALGIATVAVWVTEIGRAHV